MSNHLLKINVNPDQGDIPSAIGKGIQNAPSMIKSAVEPFLENLLNVPIAEPIDKSPINITRNFPWTKTRNIEYFENKVPEIELQEYYVASGATIANMNKIISILKSIENPIRESVADLIPGGFDPVLDSLKSFISNSEQDNTEPGWETGFVSGIPTTKKYLQVYENLYGVIASGFKYKIPFFNNDWKTINNNWTDDPLITTITKGSIGSTFQDLAKGLTTGFGVDFAKIYDYKSTGPSQSFDIILDNTFDSMGAKEGIANYQKNWELIFLLCFQNLPSKTSPYLVSPPVIYKATVRGVFSYLYSYISKLKVENIGNRQFKDVTLNTTEGTVTLTTLIPEAYRVSIEIQSFLPETKNLFYDSLNEKVVTTSVIQNPNSTPEVIKNRSSIFPDGL